MESTNTKTITTNTLKQCYPEAMQSRLEVFAPLFSALFQDRPQYTLPMWHRFLAQVGHESGQLHYLEELASGKAYEGRVDLGNTQIGDGVKYRGRGLIQITGRRNYVLCGLALDLPLLEKPELLLEPVSSLASAVWFFDNGNLWTCEDFLLLTKKINGGTNGLADRMKLLVNCQKALV